MNQARTMVVQGVNGQQPDSPYSQSIAHMILWGLRLNALPTKWSKKLSKKVHWFGKLPHTLEYPQGDGLVSHNQEENCIVPPKSKVQLMDRLSSPVP